MQMFSPLGGANSVPQIPSMDLRASSSSGKEGKGKKKKQRKGREVKRRKEGRSLSAPRSEYMFTAFVPSVHPPLLTSTFTIKLWLSLQASRYTSVCLTLYYCVLSRRLELVAAPIIYITDVTQTAVVCDGLLRNACVWQREQTVVARICILSVSRRHDGRNENEEPTATSLFSAAAPWRLGLFSVEWSMNSSVARRNSNKRRGDDEGNEDASYTSHKSPYDQCPYVRTTLL